VVFGCEKDPGVGGDETESGETGPLATETAADDEVGATETETETEDDGGFVPDETETGEDLPPPTCREMLDCVFMCLGDLGLECVQACGEGFDQEEVQKAGSLLLCLGQLCIEKEQCSLTDFTTEDCIGCIGLGLFLPKPQGCEEQAAACM